MNAITHGKKGVFIVTADFDLSKARPDLFIEEILSLFGVWEDADPVSINASKWIWEIYNISYEDYSNALDALEKYAERFRSSDLVHYIDYAWRSAIDHYIRGKFDPELLNVRGLTAAKIVEGLDEQADKDRFREDFEFAKEVVDRIFSAAKSATPPVPPAAEL
ncbi:MAG: hypothetical protein K0Q59_4337 [Paenibacillus sp.]|nr:hypothetical protein [Paenibacillus sp.]